MTLLKEARLAPLQYLCESTRARVVITQGVTGRTFPTVMKHILLPSKCDNARDCRPHVSYLIYLGSDEQISCVITQGMTGHTFPTGMKHILFPSIFWLERAYLLEIYLSCMKG